MNDTAPSTVFVENQNPPPELLNPSVPSLAHVLSEVLPGDEMDRFCHDRFKKIYKDHFSETQSPRQKLRWLLVYAKSPIEILTELRQDEEGARRLQQTLLDHPDWLKPAPAPASYRQSLLERLRRFFKQIPTAGSLESFLNAALGTIDGVLDFGAVCFTPLFKRYLSGTAEDRDKCVHRLVSKATPILVWLRVKDYFSKDEIREHEHLLSFLPVAAVPGMIMLLSAAAYAFKENIQNAWAEVNERLGIKAFFAAALVAILGLIGFKVIATPASKVEAPTQQHGGTGSDQHSGGAATDGKRGSGSWFMGCGGNPAGRSDGTPPGTDTTIPASSPDAASTALPAGCSPDGLCKVSLPPQTKSIERLRRIHGTSATDVSFIGDPGVLLHFDGNSLSTVDQALLPQRAPALFAKGDTLWLGGNGGTLLRREGGNWSKEVVGGQRASAVMVVGPITAAGSLDKAKFYQELFAHREELAACYRPRMPENPEVLHGIDLTLTVESAGSVAAAEPTQSELANPETDACIQNEVMHWRFPVSATKSQASVKLQFQGSAGEPELSGAFVRSIYSVGEQMWAVGSLGLILRRQTERWVQVPSGTKRTLYSLWGISPTDIWTVGQHGTVLHFTGTQWDEPDSGTNNDLFAVWGSGPRDIWAVGEGGVIMRFDGSAWRLQGNPLAHSLFGVWGSGPGDVWLVGEYGVVLHWDGKALQQVRSGLEAEQIDLSDVWGPGPGEMWSVGKGGALLHFRRSAQP